MKPLQLKAFLMVALGTMIEYYDMVLFIIFLPIISPILFGGESSGHALIKGYLVLFITALARPLGALFFGRIGDFISRPKALLASMYGIAITTFIIGITPPYQTIGAWSLLIVIVAKAIQTFCFGGEFSGAGIYVVEHAINPKQAISHGSFLAAIAISGSLAASLFGILVTYSFMPAWSWRIAFILGGVVGIVGIMYRKKMLESPEFKPARSQQENLLALLKQFPFELLTGTFIGGLSTIPYTTAIAFINPILMTQGFLTSHELMVMQTSIIAFSVLVLLIVGKLGNKFSAIGLMKSACMMLILMYPMLILIHLESFIGIIFISFVLIFLTELFFAPVSAFYKNLFPAPFRYRGASLSFCLGMSLLGGMTPLIENYLYQTTHQFVSIFLWILFNAVITLLFLTLMERKIKKAAFLNSLVTN